MNPVRWCQIWQTKPVSCSNDCATIESYTIPLLESSYGNIPSYSWPNHSSDVVWSNGARGGETEREEQKWKYDVDLPPALSQCPSYVALTHASTWLTCAQQKHISDTAQRYSTLTALGMSTTKFSHYAAFSGSHHQPTLQAFISLFKQTISSVRTCTW